MGLRRRAAEGREQLGLGVAVLGNRLDDHVAVGKVGRARGHLDPLGCAPVELAGLALGVSSARHADASLRASSRTVPVCVAHAASPQAMSPLPATPGRSYPAEPPIRRVTITRGPRPTSSITFSRIKKLTTEDQEQ